MTNYIKQLTSDLKYQREESERLIGKFETSATVTDGVVRWNSNNHVPPQDVLELWQHVGKVFDIEKSAAIRDTELDEFLAEYRRNPPELTAEQQSELRAVHGPGVNIVDVFTRKTVLRT